jgi:hypothetical protein
MRRIDPDDARLFLENHKRAGNKVDPKLMGEIGREGKKLYLLRLEDKDSFLSLIWYQADAVRLLAPHGEPRTLRDVAQRLRQRGDTFEALSSNLGLPREEHDPDFFKPCVGIDSCFDFVKFGWVAVVAATNEERDHSKLGSFYIYDGYHKTLVLAKRLLAGETRYQPIEALYLIPRPE